MPRQPAPDLNELLAARESGDPVRLLETRQAVVVGHMGLAWQAAHCRGRSCRHLSPADLAQEAAVGLLRATESWDPARGSWSTHAVPWTRHFISRAITDLERAVRTPAHAIYAKSRLSQYAAKLGATLGRPPSAQELSERLGVSRSDVEGVMSSTRFESSLNAPLDDESDQTRQDLTPSPYTDTADELALYELDAEVDRLLGLLPTDLELALRLRFVDSDTPLEDRLAARGGQARKTAQGRVLSGLQTFHDHARNSWNAERAALLLTRLIAPSFASNKAGFKPPPWIADVLRPHVAAIARTFATVSTTPPEANGGACILTPAIAAARERLSPPAFSRPSEPHAHATDKPWVPVVTAVEPVSPPESFKPGSAHSRAKLSEAQTQNLGFCVALGARLNDAAEWFGVCKQQAWRISTGRPRGGTRKGAQTILVVE